MPINFPNSPALNETYQIGSIIYIWNGSSWNVQNTSAGTSGLSGFSGFSGISGYSGAGMPSGGISGNLLAKTSSNNYETTWIDSTEVSWREKNPQFTYGSGATSGYVVQIGYSGGNQKNFTYTSGALTRIDYVRGALTIRKDFTYNLDGTLDYITQTEF